MGKRENRTAVARCLQWTNGHRRAAGTMWHARGVPDTSQLLEGVIRHARELEGDFRPVVAELAASGDTSLVPRIHEALRAFMTDGNWYGRDLMADILVGLIGADAFPTVLGVWAVDLGDDRDSLSATVLDLIDADRTVCLTTIRQFAEDADPDRRQAGIWAMGQAIGSDGLDDADFEIVARACRDPDGDLRATALGALSPGRNGDRALALLMAALHDPEPDVRISAVSELGYSQRTDLVPAIAAMATDPDPHVRASVASALGRLGDEAGVPAALMLVDDGHPRVRSCAVKTLGELGGDRATALLVERAGSPDPEVRRQAGEALAANVTPETLTHVRRLCNDAEAVVRASAVAALGWSKAAAGGPIVAERAKDPDPTVRLHVAVAIDRVAWPDADAVLRRLAKDRDQEVRRVAARTLELRAGRPRDE